MKISKLVLLGALLGSTALFAEETAQENVWISQDFENKEYFSKASPNGYTARTQNAGLWSQFRNDGVLSISDEQAASGNYALKYTRLPAPANYFANWIFPATLTGSFVFEAYINQEPNARFVIGLVTDNNGKKERLYSFGSFDKNLNMAYLDFTANKWKRSGIKVPADEWVKVQLEYDAAAKTISYYVFIDDVKEKIGEVDAQNMGPVHFIEFRHNASENGKALYIDDVKITKK
ncbi:MAG: hypothetical protein IKD09_03235 [Lentisphaeria bacterium]|nr:hypothetical protein [Lentisphaeria bacterium]